MEAESKNLTQVKGAVEAVDWQTVYHQLLPKVFHYFCYRVGDEALAEDLTAATFEKAWRGRKRYKRKLGEFPKWVFGIAKHVAAGHFRSSRSEVPLDENTQPSAAETVEETIQKNSDFKRLSLLLANLPPRDRELISLKYGAEMTNRAIAKLTGLSESNVGTILHRVVRQLREEWEQER
ncbi:MAG: sigma-70 family RNA polymerase sigma factor [Anaerolineae bacterium]|nr:sigma-70 family RNA polymerase sigma factor [Anaerolineae bacterium]